MSSSLMKLRCHWNISKTINFIKTLLNQLIHNTYKLMTSLNLIPASYYPPVVPYHADSAYLGYSACSSDSS